MSHAGRSGSVPGTAMPRTPDPQGETVRISRPLIGTAVGAGALGATLALGVTMASASTGADSSTVSHSAVRAATSSAAATPKPAKGSGHKCPNMSGGGTTQHSMQQG